MRQSPGRVLVVLVTMFSASMLIIPATAALAQRSVAPEGWCCHEGRVFPSTSGHCNRVGGGFFDLEQDARSHCDPGESGSVQPPHEEHTWCCRHGDVVPTSPHECEETGGRVFGSEEEAMHACREGGEPPHEEHAWCCRHGDVFPAPPHECEEMGGRVFGSEEEAMHACREGGEPPHEEHAWCCRHGDVFPKTCQAPGYSCFLIKSTCHDTNGLNSGP